MKRAHLQLFLLYDNQLIYLLLCTICLSKYRLQISDKLHILDEKTDIYNH